MPYSGAGSLNYGQYGPMSGGYNYPIGTSISNAYGVSQTNWGGSAAAGGMSGSMMGGAAAIAGSLISGYFESRNESRQIKSNAEMQKRDAEFADWRDDINRQRQLEDIREDERAVRGYAGAYKGTKPLMAPSETDPNTVKPRRPGHLGG